MPRPLANPQIDTQSIPGCWLWLGARDGYNRPLATGGYFPASANFNKQRTYRVQHYVFGEVHKYSPKSIGLICENSLCINPDHMYDRSLSRSLAKLQMEVAKAKSRLKELDVQLASLSIAQGQEADEFRSQLLQEKAQLLITVGKTNQQTTEDKDG